MNAKSLALKGAQAMGRIKQRGDYFVPDANRPDGGFFVKAPEPTWEGVRGRVAAYEEKVQDYEWTYQDLVKLMGRWLWLHFVSYFLLRSYACIWSTCHHLLYFLIVMASPFKLAPGHIVFNADLEAEETEKKGEKVSKSKSKKGEKESKSKSNLWQHR